MHRPFGATRRTLLAALAGAALTRPALAQSTTRSIAHGRGTTAVPADPQRVVVFDIAALDMIDALGSEKVVGVAGRAFPPHLAKYAGAEYPKLGTLFEPNYEAVNAARPDLIIVGGRSAAKYDDLARLAPTLAMHPGNEDYLARVITNTRLIGQVFDRSVKAEEVVAELNGAVAQLHQRASRGGKGLVVLTTGNRMSAYGVGSRFGVVHGAFGVPPAAEGLGTANHGNAVNAEFIQQTNPDWLFVIDRDAAIGRAGAARRMLDNPLVRQTTAWQKNQVVYLDPVNWYVANGGVQTTRLMVREMAEAYGRAG